jgi:hypothetical protein
MGWVNLPDVSAQDGVINSFLETPDRKISSRYVNIRPYSDAVAVISSSRLGNVTFRG